jgi:Icc-related predicted phosphoesterase
LADANGRALLLQQDVDAKTVEVAENLRQVTTAGSTAINTVIDGFRIELGKHEHAHGLARSQIN